MFLGLFSRRLQETAGGSSRPKEAPAGHRKPSGGSSSPTGGSKRTHVNENESDNMNQII
jgi:hypothetical protein